MYENYYGLAEKPFSLLPDPEYLYPSRHHQKALTLLEYGILNQAGFCVISGQAGSGKTTLIRYLLNRFDNDTTVGLLSNTHESFEELLAWILMSFGLPYQDKSKTELYQIFVDFLIEQYAKKRHTVLIIDEAQNMSPAALEELRMLSNINADKDQLLQMILMGQPGLLKNLQRPELKQFAQRIAVDYKLDAMNKDETCMYIRHRLKVAGAEVDIFDEGACKAIYYHSRGLPRLINLLCDTALVYGYAENIQMIDRRIIDDVVMERDANTILPHYHELNEEMLSAEIDDELKDSIAEENCEYALSVEGKMTSCGETMTCNEKLSSPELVASSGDDSKAGSNFDSVSPAHTASVTSLKQAEHFSKAMDLQKNAESRYQYEDSDKKEENRAESNVIHVSRDIKGRSEPESVVDVAPGTNINTPVAAVSRRGSGKLGFIILGFAFGLLMSAAVLILSKMDNLAAPVVDESKIAGRMQEIEKEFARKLQAIQQQREADLEKSRIIAQEKEASQAQAAALQRERDAALAIARAREELLQAKLKAERAAQNERLAQEKAALAQKRAQAAELEAKLIQQREKEALSAVSIPRQEAVQEPVEAAASEMMEVKPEASLPEPFPIETPTAEPVQMISAAGDQEKQLTDEAEAGFLSNPCEGPTAVFVSTCKK